MNRTRHLTIAGLALAVGLSACSGGGGTSATDANDRSEEVGFQAEGLPIVQEQLTLTAGGEKSALAPDYETMELVQQWEADTGITIDWVNQPAQIYQERKNLMLASDELPDILWNSGLSDSELVTNGGNGTILALEDLIEEHAPNLTAVLEERPDLRAAITASDGHIYALPHVEELGLVQYPNFIYINTTWLDELGLEMPTTIDEYETALEAFATQDPNGNGQADEIPLSFRTNSFAANPADLIAALGGIPDNNDHRIVQDGEVIFTAQTDEFRQAVDRLGDWYSRGLIDQESFSQDDTQYLAKGKTDTPILGSFIWWELREFVGDDRMDDYEIVGVLEGVDGRMASVSNNAEIGRSAMVITRSNEYPAATMRWADRMFDPVMSAQNNWGPIGVTLEENEDGLLVQIPAEGESEGERRQRVAPGGPKITTREHFETVVAPEPRAAERQEIIAELYEPYAANDPYPPVMLSNDELQRIDIPMADVHTLVTEKFASWIVNDNVDAEWDSYITQLQSLGIDDIMETYQQAYDRFMEGQ